ncbi:dGTP triphosphohydrolase [Planctomicrobium sp. SH527]|uniref:dGTP triphosphohydrolase n=1 Tax=Planctomicrobium sp. SH527 TaxID=3448123 RepID=UPI003F5B8ED3
MRHQKDFHSVILNKYLSKNRLRRSTIRRDLRDEFYSDRSRIVFSSSFRRMMKKAQVFSLETNTSVRNRLTHTLEVSDLGRTLARRVGNELESNGRATQIQSECMVAIVENACLLHDIGNPPFGHFGEEAIKAWFTQKNLADFFPSCICQTADNFETLLSDFRNFDGNPQGFRIATRLHSKIDEYSFNLTCSTLLASVKYPYFEGADPKSRFSNKRGIFLSEKDRYLDACDLLNHKPDHRYFLAYLMELADDIGYCLSDISDSLEKKITNPREYKAEMEKICKDEQIEQSPLIPNGDLESFEYQVAIPIAQRTIEEASKLFAKDIEKYQSGEGEELSAEIQSGKHLKCLKRFARRFIYTSPEAQRIEIAGSRIVRGLLDHFGMLLQISRTDFELFLKQHEMPKGSKLDTEVRVFNQLSRRMLNVYQTRISEGASNEEEWIERARLIVDYIAGLTDDSARDVYQNFMGISL